MKARPANFFERSMARRGNTLLALLTVLLILTAYGPEHGVGAAGVQTQYLDLDRALAWLDLDLHDSGEGGQDAGVLNHAGQLQWGTGQSGAAATRALRQVTATDPLAQRRDSEKRCRYTRGGWCGLFDKQAPLPLRPPPRGKKGCPKNCSGVGNCNYDTGTCDCPAGSQGEDCGTVLLRPCTIEFGLWGNETLGHIDDEGRDLDLLHPGYTESRCTGICDPITARCFCDGTYRRVNPPKGSPPGTPVPVRGRPLPNHMCQLSDDGKGHKLEWGQVPWGLIYGPDGWCNSDKPVFKCPCLFDGFAGELCDEITETMCPNQCSGHGECDSGFCKCHEGWYGTDCARKAAGQQLSPGLHETGARPWLEKTVKIAPEAMAAAMDPSGGLDAAQRAPLLQARRRPLIYVYDLPPAYNARMLQYRNDRFMCTWRLYDSGNSTSVNAWTYGLEVLMHEMMLQSEHRTFDPEEADYFYVPVYGSCYIFPLHCYADGPWWHVPSGPRVMHVTNMMLEVRDWIRNHFPYWDRRGGRDHIWLMNHDEGACYAPTEIYNVSIFLTHWGRTDLDHASNTAFTPDNYTQEWVHPKQPDGWLRLIRGHPCYTKGKDLVIPALKQPLHFSGSPLLLHPPRERTILLYLRGDMGKHRLVHYSRGIRQRLYKLWQEKRWREQNVLIGTGDDIPGRYTEHLSSSKFCIVAPGDGWSPRLEDAVLHGCVPVMIMDGVEGVWEDQLEFEQFSVRVREADLDDLPARLAAIPPRVVEEMQRRMRGVWHRYAYTSHPLLSDEAAQVIGHNLGVWRQQLEADGSRDRAQVERLLTQLRGRAVFPEQDDAFHTILQWLYWKIPQTR